MKHIVFFLTAALLLNASCGSSDEGGKTDPPAAPVPVAPTTELGKADEAIENLQLKPGKLISINQVNAANCRRAVAAGMCIDIMASDKIVFASDMTDERLDGLFAECGEAIRSTKADFWGLHLPYQTYDISSTNENTRVTAVLKLKRLIELTIEHLRPQHFVIHPGTGTILTTGGDFAERTVQSRKSLAELQRHIESCNAQHGTKAILCVENCARSLAYDGDSLLDLLDAEGLEKVRVCLDTGHALIPLNSKYIDPAALRTLLPYIEKEKLSIGFVEKDNCYFNLIDERSANFAKELGQGTADIAARIAQNPIYQLSAFLPDNYEEEFLRRCPGCLAVRWSPDFADILPEGGGKPNGLAAMLKHFGWTRDEAIAFGDGGNDVAMLEYAGIGVAMGNACDDAKAAADRTGPDAEPHGVADLCRELWPEAF